MFDPDESATPAESARPLIRAAAYARMSTDLQEFSIEFQCKAIDDFAAAHRMTVVRTYLDRGKSGLTLRGRPGLQALLADVQQRRADFTVVLVYDISRWGRFQDVDEGAYYEQLCKRADVKVIFCAETFEQDDSPMSGVLKTIKRVMAGEYSRNLSARTWGGQMYLTKLGFKGGGTAGFGLRRMMISTERKPKCILEKGEYKNLAKDRVILVPGPREEVELVWQIYDWFAFDRKTMNEIARLLNERRRSEWPKWTQSLVRGVLKGPKYAGDAIFNRHSHRLNAKQKKNPKEQWVRCERAYQALVSKELFDHVQDLLNFKRNRYSTRFMQKKLWELLQVKGELSGKLIRNEPGMPTPQSYLARFGGLNVAYESVGYCRLKHRPFIQYRKEMADFRTKLIGELIAGYGAVDVAAQWDKEIDALRVNDTWALSIIFLRSYIKKGGNLCWGVHLIGREFGDKLLLVRLGMRNSSILDYHLIPRHAIRHVPKMLRPGARSIQAYKIAGQEALFMREAAVLSKPTEALRYPVDKVWARELSTLPREWVAPCPPTIDDFGLNQQNLRNHFNLILRRLDQAPPNRHLRLQDILREEWDSIPKGIRRHLGFEFRKSILASKFPGWTLSGYTKGGAVNLYRKNMPVSSA